MGWLVVYNCGSWNHCDHAIEPELVRFLRDFVQVSS